LALIGFAFYRENILIPLGLIALLVVAMDFLYQAVKTKDRNPQICFWAFRHNRWVGLIIFIGIFTAQFI
jgi:4-hydroxybenzoate polyprenyltransferase